MIIGQPKSLEEYMPLTPQEFEGLRQQLDAGIVNGTPMNAPVGLDFGTVCRLASTIGHFAVRIEQLTNPKPEIDASGEPPLPILRPSAETE